MTTTDMPDLGPELTTVDATSNDRLNQLHAAYPAAKAAADAAAEQLKVITDGIKLELQTLAPEETAVRLTGGDGPAMRLVYTESWRVDSKKLKREDPETYVRFATKGGAWRLTAEKGGESE